MQPLPVFDLPGTFSARFETRVRDYVATTEHQTIIGEEALLQLAKVDEVPDVLVGCTGGGSNFGGFSSANRLRASRT